MEQATKKIGTSYDKLLSPSQAKRKGKEIKEAFIEAIDGLGDSYLTLKKYQNKDTSKLSMVEKLSLIAA